MLVERMQAEQTERYTKAAHMRKIKNVIHKFNYFLSDIYNRRNKGEQRRFNILKDDEKYSLRSRLFVLQMHFLLPDIEKMGFTLFYNIDELDSKNNEFIYFVEYGELRGLKVLAPFTHEKELYKKIKDYNHIINLSDEQHRKTRMRLMEKKEIAAEQEERQRETPPSVGNSFIWEKIGESMAGGGEYRAELAKGITFIADDESKQILSDYMEDYIKKRIAPRQQLVIF